MVIISRVQVDDFDTQDITDNALQDLNSALENREAIHHQVGTVYLLGYHLVILSQHGLPPRQVCAAVETIGDIAAGGGGGGGVGEGGGQEGDEEGRGLLTLLCEARAQLQVLLEH